jgi:hypothetical protein
MALEHSTEEIKKSSGTNLLHLEAGGGAAEQTLPKHVQGS